MKKILILNRSINQGGIDDVGVELAKFLTENYEVYMCLFFNELDQQFPKVKIKSIDVKPASNAFGKAFNFVRRFLAFRRVRKEINPDVVIAQGNFPDFMVAFDNRFGGKYKSILTVHNILSKDLVGLKGRFERFLFQLVANWPSSWVAVSEAVKKDFEKTFEAKKVGFITNPIRPLEVEEPVKIENRFIFSAGRLAPQKDFSTLIKAFSLVEKNVKGVNLIIAGDGRGRSQLEVLINELGLSKKVQLIGHVKNIYPYLTKAEFFASSSIYEGTPMTVLQALDLGKAVVATDVDGTVFAAGGAGLYSPIGDSEELANNIVRLLEDKELKSSLEQEAKKQKEKFTMKALGKNWEELIESL